MCSDTVSYVMAATPCAVVVSIRAYCIPTVGSRGRKGAALFSVHARPIFQPVSKNIFFHFSSTRSSSAKCGILSKPTVGPCSAANGNGIATRYKAARSLLLKVDVHGLEELVNHGLNELGRVCIQHLQTCFALGEPRTRTSRHCHFRLETL